MIATIGSLATPKGPIVTTGTCTTAAPVGGADEHEGADERT